MARTPTCHPERKHKARGLCFTCYAKRPRNRASCRHPDRPERARGLCGACYETYAKVTNPAYAERVAARQRLYYEQNVVARREAERSRYRRTGGDVAWAYNIQQKYGVTAEWVADKSAQQNHACAICSKPFSLERKRPAIDHCHTTGRVRSLLCQMCNTALGCAQDSAPLLRQMADYLDGFK